MKTTFLTRLLKDDAAIFSELSVKYHRIVDEDIVSMLADIIREGKQQGQIRDIDEQVVAYAGLKLFQRLQPYANDAV